MNRPFFFYSFGLILLGFAFVYACQTSDSDNLEYCECQSWEGWKNQDDIKCGYLTVPEDHTNPDRKKIKIAFAIFKSQNPDPEAIPVIILTGGPGGRSLDSPSKWLSHEARQIGDVIVVEQRGIGLSSGLPDLTENFVDIIAADATSEEEMEITKKTMLIKMEEIKAKGIDPSKYNSTQNAKDILSLMNALEYNSYNLYGTAYGTKLSIMVMKYAASKIHASVLVGPASLNKTALESRFQDLLRAINILYTKCATDPDCQKAHPDLRSETIQAIQSLKDNPITVRLLNRDFTLNPQDVIFFIRYLLYKPDAFEVAPRFVKAINERDIPTIQELGEYPAQLLRAGNISAFFSFIAYEEFSNETPAHVTAIMQTAPELGEGIAWFQAFIPALVQWHDGRVTDEENRLENIPVPTLIITNDFDPVTPPANTKLFENALSNEQVLRLNRFGHGSGGKCISGIRQAFLLHPEKRINTQCLDGDGL